MAKSEPTARHRIEPTADPISEAPIELEGSGIKIRWKLVLMILAVLMGGGTVAGLSTRLGIGSDAAEDLTAFQGAQAAAHVSIDKALAASDVRAEKQDQKIETVSKAITSVQTIQQRDVSRNEARRLTESIASRRLREETYDRLYELNLRRLQRGEDPCGTVACE